MKRNILLLLTFLGGMQLLAQHVATVHLKDGSTLKFENGYRQETSMHFIENNPDAVNNDIRFTNADKVVQKIANEYVAAIFWDNPAFMPLLSSMSIVVSSTEQKLTLDNCDLIVDYNKYEYYPYSDYYVVLGSADVLNTSEFGNYMQDNYRIWGFSPNCDYPLVKGHTYYYRVALRTPYWENDEKKEICNYSEEETFRVPYMMDDCGLVPASLCGPDVIFPDSTAWEAFFQQHSVNAPDFYFESFGRLWMEWLSEHKDEVTVSRELTFDDGQLHLVDAIPEAFYEWLTHREVVINSSEQILSVENGQLEAIVTDVDAEWQIPGNCYMRFSPQNRSNQVITFDASECVPGLNYQMVVTFAPETLYSEDYHSDFRPTMLNIKASQINTEGKKETNNFDNTRYEIPATEVTRVTIDNVSNIVEAIVQSNVFIRETSICSRIIRLAEIRLTPMNQ